MAPASRARRAAWWGIAERLKVGCFLGSWPSKKCCRIPKKYLTLPGTQEVHTNLWRHERPARLKWWRKMFWLDLRYVIYLKVFAAVTLGVAWFRSVSSCKSQVFGKYQKNCTSATWSWVPVQWFCRRCSLRHYRPCFRAWIWDWCVWMPTSFSS